MWMPALSRLDLHLASVLLLTLALTLSMYNNARASGTSLETIACTLATVSTAAASFASAMSRDAEALTTDEEVCKVDALQLVNQLMQGGAPSQTGSQACQAVCVCVCVLSPPARWFARPDATSLSLYAHIQRRKMLGRHACK